MLKTKFVTLFLVAAGMVVTPASSACPPWVTVAHDVVERSLPVVNIGFVAGNLQATRRFVPLLLEQDRRNIRATNFRKYVLVAALSVFPTSGHNIDIDDLVLARGRLTVRIAVHDLPPGAGVFFTVMTAYQVVRIPKAALGHPLPRSVTIAAATP